MDTERISLFCFSSWENTITLSTQKTHISPEVKSSHGNKAICTSNFSWCLPKTKIHRNIGQWRYSRRDMKLFVCIYYVSLLAWFTLRQQYLNQDKTIWYASIQFVAFLNFCINYTIQGHDQCYLHWHFFIFFLLHNLPNNELRRRKLPLSCTNNASIQCFRKPNLFPFLVKVA